LPGFLRLRYSTDAGNASFIPITIAEEQKRVPTEVVYEHIQREQALAIYLSLLLALLSAFTAQPVASAASEQITLDTKYPWLSAPIGSSYEFDIDITYTGGDKPKIFDLKATVPAASTTPSAAVRWRINLHNRYSTAT